ncbi:MAG TPA: HoxN/HupN/NixA family nickel/cobalt transporter [Opitutaceae bacterium]|jgi:high-affinity nickel-transport protein
MITVSPPRLRTRIVAIGILLVAINTLAWAWAFFAFRHYPAMLGTALLAYMFGLRHAVDADHIAAIDNVTRKLMQQGQKPVGVGFYFSLGHSTIVFALTLLIAWASLELKGPFARWADLGGVLGTVISAGFLLVIGAANLVIFVSLCRACQSGRRGGILPEEDIDILLDQRGFFGRLFRSLFRLINHSWQMYLIGFLFGLGFDTATEVGLLAVSSREAARGLPISTILVFPALFTAGMALVDTGDGILMLGAYGWAFVNPRRKLGYNLTVTFVSVIVALFIGAGEIVGLCVDRGKPKGALWDAAGALNDHLGAVGLAVIALFLLSWTAWALVYRRWRAGEASAKSFG